jgi:hypothetical protein
LAFIGGYYNDPHRLAALLPVVTLPLVALGLQQILSLLTAQLNERQALIRLQPFITVVLAVVTVAALTLGTQVTQRMNAAVDEVSYAYQVLNETPLVNRDELALIDQLPSVLPPGARVATNPWNGSSMAYALVGVLTTTTHVLYNRTPEEVILEQHLNEAAAEPDLVCPALRHLGVEYALDFGDLEIVGQHEPMPGLADLNRAPGFTPIARVGQAVLYRIVACS